MTKSIIFKKDSLFLFLLFTIFTWSIAFSSSDSGIEHYIKNLRTLKASFLQYNPDGSVVSGALYVSKPKYLRLEYHRPNQIIININAPFITYYDKDLDQAMNVPASDVFIDILKDNYQDLSNNLYYKNKKAYLKLKDKDNGEIIFRFNTEPIEIEGIDMLNNGHNVKISFSDLHYNIPIHNKIFMDFN